MATFVDIQGFRGNGSKFIIKEIAVYHLGDLFKHIFKPPYSYSKLENKYKKQAHWLSLNHHGLFWNDGTIPYSRVKEIIYKDLVTNNNEHTIIYVKGDQKVQWLQDYCNVSAANIDTVYDCPDPEMILDFPLKHINITKRKPITFAQKNVLKIYALGYYKTVRSHMHEYLDNIESFIQDQQEQDDPKITQM